MTTTAHATAPAVAEHRMHAPKSAACLDDLLTVIRRDWQDADEARAELHRWGWTDEHIRQYTGR